MVLPVKVVGLCSIFLLLGTEHEYRGGGNLGQQGVKRKKRSGLAGSADGEKASLGSDQLHGLPVCQHLSLFRHHFTDGDWCKKADMNTSDIIRLFTTYAGRSISTGSESGGKYKPSEKEILKVCVVSG